MHVTPTQSQDKNETRVGQPDIANIDSHFFSFIAKHVLRLQLSLRLTSGGQLIPSPIVLERSYAKG